MHVTVHVKVVSYHADYMKISPVTQQDIAKKLNVSRVTVSKALRNHPDISAEMKEKVYKAVREMGYSPNLIAQQLSHRRSFTIGIVIPDLENSFFAFLIDSIIDTATEHNYQILLTVSRENEEIERKNIHNLLSMRVDGMLVCVSESSMSADIYDYVRKVGIPLVFFDRAFKNIGFRHVVFDDAKGTTEAINSLVREGYTNIAHFAGYRHISIGRERCEHFLSAIRENGLTVEKHWIIEGGFEIKDGYNSFQKLTATGDLPEVILAVNDRVALGTYEAILKAGLKIPEDIGVIGYGFSENARFFNPGLAIINQDPRQMGRVAVNMLIDEILDQAAKLPSETLISTDFQWNNSIRRMRS